MSECEGPVPPDDVDHSWPAVRDHLARLWCVARTVLGVLLIVGGVLGTLLPVLPGVPLLIGGVALLGPDHRLVRPFRQRVEQWRNRRTRGALDDQPP